MKCHCLFVAAWIGAAFFSASFSLALQVEESRHVPLEGQSNFRDIGGYQTSDGKTLKRGFVYRSG